MCFIVWKNPRKSGHWLRQMKLNIRVARQEMNNWLSLALDLNSWKYRKKWSQLDATSSWCIRNDLNKICVLRLIGWWCISREANINQITVGYCINAFGFYKWHIFCISRSALPKPSHTRAITIRVVFYIAHCTAFILRSDHLSSDSVVARAEVVR